LGGLFWIDREDDHGEEAEEGQGEEIESESEACCPGPQEEGVEDGSQENKEDEGREAGEESESEEDHGAPQSPEATACSGPGNASGGEPGDASGSGFQRSVRRQKRQRLTSGMRTGRRRVRRPPSCSHRHVEFRCYRGALAADAAFPASAM
jgi:hypothetical protein